MLKELLVEPSKVSSRFFVEDDEDQEEESVRMYLAGKETGPYAALCHHSDKAIGKPHYHYGSQFQLFLHGSTTFPDRRIDAPGVHYTDHNTPYGPFTMDGDHKMLVLWGRSAGQVWMNEPGAAKDVNRAGRRMIGSASDVAWEVISNHPVVRRKSFLPTGSGPKGEMFECEPGGQTPSSIPQFGRYEFVWSGQVSLHGKLLEPQTLRYVRGDEAPAPLKAGPQGATIYFCSFDADVDKGKMGGLNVFDRLASFKETKAAELKSLRVKDGF